MKSLQGMAQEGSKCPQELCLWASASFSAYLRLHWLLFDDLTQNRVAWEERFSGEELPPSKAVAFSLSVGQFLDR